MAKHVTTTSTEGFASTSEIRDFSIDIDPSGEAAPDTLEMLLATYAACYVPALRVGAEQRGVEELGQVTFDVSGQLNDDDKLKSITFDIEVETELDEETAATVVDRADALCKVHDAIKPSLEANVTLNGFPA